MDLPAIERSAQGLLGQTPEHPLLNYFRRRLEALLGLIQFEEEGQPVEPDAFRLQNLHLWALEDYSDVFQAIGPLSGYCNLRCRFCYEDGNALLMERSILSQAEAETRIRHYRRKEKKGLLGFLLRRDEEPFTNPHLIEVLRQIRKTDPELDFHLTTNGKTLNEDIVAALADLKPFHIVVSLNTADGALRRDLMGDHHPETAKEVFPLFRRHGIPFLGSIVAWPTLPLDDLCETVRFLDRQGSAAIRVTLPGYSKHFPTPPLDDWEEHWAVLVKTLKPLSSHIASPLLLSPSLFHNTPLEPDVAGVIPNSPAALAGIRAGDLLVAIDGNPLPTRADARQELTRCNQPGKVRRLVYSRNDQTAEVDLQIPLEGSEQWYPYWPRGYPMPSRHALGIVVHDDLDPRWLANAVRYIRDTGSRRSLLFCSKLLAPTVASLFRDIPVLTETLGEATLDIRIPVHRYWGGNILVGDLWTCGDLVAAVEGFCSEVGYRPDLVLIPSTFTRNLWVDLLGVPWTAVEQATGCRVELLRVQRLMM